MPDQSAAPACRDCGRPISAVGARYRGTVRCRACANRAKGGTFTPETAGAAADRRHELARENAKLAALYRQQAKKQGAME